MHKISSFISIGVDKKVHDKVPVLGKGLLNENEIVYISIVSRPGRTTEGGRE
ncbi:protein of unknown function [Mesotoga infera]|uniref:Uncharacterized protein n=1 Tax=Mesotoga infera TaxID=1236046 RepID=A0A7Z7LFF0_9BACT|nr:protein of unknown function [Mesotoga infera]